MRFFFQLVIVANLFLKEESLKRKNHKTCIELKGPQNSKLFLIGVNNSEKSREQVKELIRIIKPSKVVLELNGSPYNESLIKMDEKKYTSTADYWKINFVKYYKRCRSKKVTIYCFIISILINALVETRMSHLLRKPFRTLYRTFKEKL